MFGPIADHTYSLRRAAAVLASVALLNVQIAPAASACDHGSETAAMDMADMDHATMQEHDMARAEHVAAPRSGQGATLVIATASDCENLAGACADNCAAMPGCASAAFVGTSSADTAQYDVEPIAPASARLQAGRTTAPDHPPPRA